MQTTVSIPGIHCTGCAALIKDVTADFPSITKIDIDLKTKQVTLEHDERLTIQKWTEAIEALDAKYKVQPVL